MTDEELNAEHTALRADQDKMKNRHAFLRQHPEDRAGHLAHAENLKRHIARLHEHASALHDRLRKV